MRIFLIGFMGSGKSYWGRQWAKERGCNYFDLDDVIVAKEGKTVTEIFEQEGEGQFRILERDTLRGFAELDHFILSCGGGTPCFNDNMKWMNEHGHTVYMKASPAYLLNNLLEGIAKRPLLKDLQPEEILLFIENKLKEREPIYLQAEIVIIAGQKDLPIK